MLLLHIFSDIFLISNYTMGIRPDGLHYIRYRLCRNLAGLVLCRQVQGPLRLAACHLPAGIFLNLFEVSAKIWANDCVRTNQCVPYTTAVFTCSKVNLCGLLIYGFTTQTAVSRPVKPPVTICDHHETRTCLVGCGVTLCRDFGTDIGRRLHEE